MRFWRILVEYNLIQFNKINTYKVSFYFIYTTTRAREKKLFADRARDAVASARRDVRDVPDGDVELGCLEQFVDVVAGFAALLGRYRAAALGGRLAVMGVEALEAVLREVEPGARRFLVLLVAKHDLVEHDRVLLDIVVLDEVSNCSGILELGVALVNRGLKMLLVLLLLLVRLLVRLGQELLVVVPGGLSVDRVEEVGVHDCTWRGGSD